MHSATLRTKACRAICFFSLIGISITLISGCEPDPYPLDMEYPERQSPVILQKPDWNRSVRYFPELGHFPQERKKIYAEGTGKIADPRKVPRPLRERVKKILTSYFLTPAQPLLKGATPDQIKAIFSTPRNGLSRISTAENVYDTFYRGLMRGSKLYRRHCLHCHGVSGNGRGPTAAWVNPHPRDYRRGLFKFKSTPEGGKPLHSDLYRTLYEGVEGTSMPSFKVLPEDELDDLVAYVIHLSIRGEVEYNLYRALLQDPKVSPEDEMESFYPDILAGWAQPEKVTVHKYDDTIIGKAIKAAESAEANATALKASVERGYKAFLNEGACIQCHQNFGRSSDLLIDDWGTMVRPADLTKGVYRGGHRPIDLYNRIYAGIYPSGMPKAGNALASSPDLMWDLVNFVRALPYPEMLPDEIRAKIYGDKVAASE